MVLNDFEGELLPLRITSDYYSIRFFCVFLYENKWSCNQKFKPFPITMKIDSGIFSIISQLLHVNRIFTSFLYLLAISVCSRFALNFTIPHTSVKHLEINFSSRALIWDLSEFSMRQSNDYLKLKKVIFRKDEKPNCHWYS